MILQLSVASLMLAQLLDQAVLTSSGSNWLRLSQHRSQLRMFPMGFRTSGWPCLPYVYRMARVLEAHLRVPIPEAKDMLLFCSPVMIGQFPITVLP